MKKTLVSLLFVLVCLSVLAAASADLEIRFLNVGQGDATLILCDGEAVLIDGGTPGTSEYLYSYLRNTLRLASLRAVIATHPHEDHIGGLPAALSAVPAELLLTPVLRSDSSSFAAVMDNAGKQGAVIQVPVVGDTFTVGSAEMEIVSCWQEAWDLNDMSIVARLKYGEFTALFTGDAEYMAEFMMLDSGVNLQATLLKIGHHGSDSSTTEQFLRAVNPRYAVISCGAGNEYGHPHQSVLDLLKKQCVEIFRTDLQGEIIFQVKDGSQIVNTTERSIKDDSELFTAPAMNQGRSNNPSGMYVVNVKSGKFHLPECESVMDIYYKNRKDYTCPREDLIDAGYRPCHRCNP